MSQLQGTSMEFPPLDGLKLWHLLQTHVSAGCGGDTLKVVQFDGNIHHPPQHMQEISVYTTNPSTEDQRLKMNPHMIHNGHHPHEKLASCSCPMCPPTTDGKSKHPHNMKHPPIMEHPHNMNMPPMNNPPHILHQPNQSHPNNMKMPTTTTTTMPPQPPTSSGNLSCSVCHKKIRNSKKQQTAAARNPNYSPICDKCSKSHKDLYHHNNIGNNNAHNNNAQSQNSSSAYAHSSHNSMNHHHNDYNDRHAKGSRGDCGKFKCSKCDKYFSNGGNLKRHAMIHTGEKPYNCHVCNKSFRSKTLLSNHIRTHTGEKPFLCHLCDKKFSKAENLKRHVKIHVKHTLG